MELKSISPFEKVGYQKLSREHWIVYTEIIIDAAPKRVWEVLTDTESYAKWNVVFIMDGKIQDKSKMKVLFKMNKKVRPILFRISLHVEEGVEFYWSQFLAMGIKDLHCFRVEATSDGKTKFIQSDQALGGMTWLLGKMIVKSQTKIYPRFNRSLKTEVERRYSKS